MQKKEITKKEKEKEYRISCEKIEREARKILCLAKGPTTYLSSKLLVLLKWYQVPLKEVPGKASRVVRWADILEQRLQPPASSKWTDADKVQLKEMKEIKIDIEDTAPGRHRATMKRQLFASVTTMSAKDRENLQRELNSCNVAGTPPCVEEDPSPAQANPSEANDDGGATKEHSGREEV